MIVLRGQYKLAFFKLGDTTWTIFDYKKGCVDDIIFFEWQFYALLGNRILVAVDIGSEPKLSGHKCCLHECFIWDSSYLVNYYGCLLIVTTELEEDENDDAADGHYLTSKFRVFQIDLVGDDTYEVEDIAGDALFLGKNCSIVIGSSDFKGCMANSLYFAFGGAPKMKYGYDDMGVYKLEDGSIERLYSADIYDPPQSCPIWLVPNPW
ncbi:hypothetical protein LUZ60_001622 [Juncus effusus]|nr:hypothetical protein LUZ60_001622 [Juncus effusus]